MPPNARKEQNKQNKTEQDRNSFSMSTDWSPLNKAGGASISTWAERLNRMEQNRTEQNRT
jgi:hypothetical protein